MMDADLLERVAEQLGQAPVYADDGSGASILTLAARSYASRPAEDEVGRLSGFDASAAALFEAIVESAYLVAQADGQFDQAERSAFEHVVVIACEGAVAARQMQALLSDLQDQLAEDGVDKRIRMIGRTIRRASDAREVLRIAALLAGVSGGISDVERDVLSKLTREFGITEADLHRAVDEAERALSG